jgi:hypothetical protein
MYLHHNHNREVFTRKALKYAPGSACYVLERKKSPYAAVFVSYWTDMAVILDGICYLNVNRYSVSTTRHINRFMLEYGGLNYLIYASSIVVVTPDVVKTLRYYLEHFPTVQEARDYLLQHSMV